MIIELPTQEKIRLGGEDIIALTYRTGSSQNSWPIFHVVALFDRGLVSSTVVLLIVSSPTQTVMTRPNGGAVDRHDLSRILLIYVE